MYKALVVLIALLLVSGYLFFTKPGKVVINEKGKVEGILNKSRSLIQGDRFWKYQLRMATESYNKNNTPQLPSSAEMQSLYRKLREDQKLLDEKMKVLFTQDEQNARALRIKADSLELNAKWRSIDDAAETARVQELEKFKVIIPMLEAKLHITHPQPASVAK